MSKCDEFPERCDKHSEDLYNMEFDKLDSQLKKDAVCDECDSYDQAHADAIFERIKDEQREKDANPPPEYEED